MIDRKLTANGRCVDSLTIESANQFGNRREAGTITVIATANNWRNTLHYVESFSGVGRIRTNVQTVAGSEFVTILVDYSNKRDESRLYDWCNQEQPADRDRVQFEICVAPRNNRRKASSQTVSGYVSGSFGFHCESSEDQCDKSRPWAVTHLLTGRAVYRFRTLFECRTFAQWIRDIAPEFETAKTCQEARRYQRQVGEAVVNTLR